jgi:hypothetical protein
MKSADSFAAVAADARAQCSPERYNLDLQYELPIAVIDEPFVRSYEARAELWLKEETPASQHLSHGRYFRGELGREYLTQELQRKRTSQRALLSLICMDDLLGRHPERTTSETDAPLPAFLILQCAVVERVLYMTAYFRALEVVEFLPINLAEVALHCRRIRSHFPELVMLRLAVFAFRAYAEPGFRCLQKATVDTIHPIRLHKSVEAHDFETLRRWLAEKKQPDSAIVLDGLQALRESLDLISDDPRYSKVFRDAIEAGVGKLGELKDLRQRTSQGERVKSLWKDFAEILDRAIGEISGRPGGAP